MPRKGVQVPGATEITKRSPRKPRAAGANPEPHPNRAPRTAPPRSPASRPVAPPAAQQPKSRAAFGHIHYDGVRVTVTITCPWCGDEHIHKPGQPTHHVCPQSDNRYSVLVPLQAFEVLV
jgi:hypothetical protein